MGGFKSRSRQFMSGGYRVPALDDLRRRTTKIICCWFLFLPVPVRQRDSARLANIGLAAAAASSLSFCHCARYTRCPLALLAVNSLGRVARGLSTTPCALSRTFDLWRTLAMLDLSLRTLDGDPKPKAFSKNGRLEPRARALGRHFGCSVCKSVVAHAN